ncbi:MAG TPA: glycosyltransferase family 39 protein, partial [Verrucomicrobiae bacterium]|nr:glycosyltransferase family 39 protein [Verrucomicrobiae bacterium]
MNLNIKALIKKTPRSVKFAVLIVILAKILVLTIGYAVAYINSGPAPPLTILMSMFYHWDAPHYVSIAENGYVNTGDAANLIVFFPLYPILIRLFTVDFNYINLSALIVSNACSLIAFLYLYKLAKLEFNDSVAVKAVLFLSVFPTAYFLSAPYTEGLFFALVIASIYYARLGKWQFAGLISLLAALTRVGGVLLLPVLLVEFFHQKGWKPEKTDLRVLWPFLALAGFIIYLGINYQVTGNPLTFMTIEATHWFNRIDPRAGLEAAYSWARNAAYPDDITIGLAPLVFAIFGLVMVGVSIWRRLRPVYLVYMFLTWALAVSTSWWISVPRYVMSMFPIFMVLGLVTNRKAFSIAIVVISGALLCYFTVFFVLGLWA